jgi:hypothetical protein
MYFIKKIEDKTKKSLLQFNNVVLIFCDKEEAEQELEILHSNREPKDRCEWIIIPIEDLDPKIKSIKRRHKFILLMSNQYTEACSFESIMNSSVGIRYIRKSERRTAFFDLLIKEIKD